MNSSSNMRSTIAAGFASLVAVGVAFGQAADEIVADEIVEVVGQTPLGARVDADRMAANVQTATAGDLDDRRSLDLADFMKRNLASVFVNEAQSNPLQPDLQYRGFVGSPLLGLPQGIAVYQDGVRINEPFGDTVNWALIPESAIASIALMPGSNPLFGLNALGGAVAVETKTGFTHSGTRAELFGGSFGRIGIGVETGGTISDRFAHFVTASYLDERGWRDFSPTTALQAFAKLGWRLDRTDVSVGMSLADTDLIGNGAAPVELVARDRAAIFTRPDRTENALILLSADAERRMNDRLTVTGNVYVRSSDIDTLNGDDSDFEECIVAPGFMCAFDDDVERLVLDRDGVPIPAADVLEGATVNQSVTRQDGFGLGLESSWNADLGRGANAFVVGLALDDGRIRFSASTELGTLDETRLAIPGGVFVGDAFTGLRADVRTVGLYLADTVSPSERLSVTLAGRFNRTRVTLRDQIGTALNGEHRFSRFNPALGVTWRMTDALGVYAGYSESSRVPSPVELTCADEDDPCRLPNAFLADPPLEQVVAETIEAGVRGNSESGQWHAGVFDTLNREDILFISAGALTNEGYFDNVGKTRRRGVEIDASGQTGDRVSWFANFTYLDATFRERISFPSPNNPAAIDGEIAVEPGDRLPLIPRSLFKAGLRVMIGSRATLGVDVMAASDFHARGDEGNGVAPIGRFSTLGLRADYEVNRQLLLFANLDNAFDSEYESFGVFGEPEDVLGDDYDDPRFISPAAPRAAWFGVRVSL